MAFDSKNLKSAAGLLGAAFNRFIAGSDGRVLWEAAVKGVLYENGALTELGNKYVTEIEQSKTYYPGPSSYSTTGYYPLKLNKNLNLKILWDISLGIAAGKGDVFGVMFGTEQVYSHTDAGNSSYLSTGFETTHTDVNELLATLICSDKGSTGSSFIRLAIRKIEAV